MYKWVFDIRDMNFSLYSTSAGSCDCFYQSNLLLIGVSHDTTQEKKQSSREYEEC